MGARAVQEVLDLTAPLAARAGVSLHGPVARRRHRRDRRPPASPPGPAEPGVERHQVQPRRRAGRRVGGPERRPRHAHRARHRSRPRRGTGRAPLRPLRPPRVRALRHRGLGRRPRPEPRPHRTHGWGPLGELVTAAPARPSASISLPPWPRPPLTPALRIRHSPEDDREHVIQRGHGRLASPPRTPASSSSTTRTPTSWSSGACSSAPATPTCRPSTTRAWRWSASSPSSPTCSCSTCTCRCPTASRSWPRSSRSSRPTATCPILVLTADITESTRERALAVGARDFLTKPFRYTELLLRINNLLETRALHTQLRRDKALLEARMREQQATDQARAERRRSASRRVEAVLASDRNGPTPESGIGLQIVYQPILDLTTGEVLGAEALSRFGTEPQRSPAQWFIEAAEVGLGIQLELAALRRAAEGLSLLPPGAFLSVNASAETIRSPALLNALEGLPGSRMVIELTEHEHVEDYEQLVAPVTALRERGVRLAVDDAGAGFASLQHILRLEARPHQARPDLHRRAGRRPGATGAHHGAHHLRPRHRSHARRRGHRHRCRARRPPQPRGPPRTGPVPRRAGQPPVRPGPVRPPRRGDGRAPRPRTDRDREWSAGR